MAIVEFPNTAGGRSNAEAVPGQKHTWSDGEKIIVFTGDDVPYLDPRPTVTKWQLVQACADAGWTEDKIDASVAMMTTKRKRFWEHTQVIDRDNPFSSNLRTNMLPVPTPAQWNAIFLAAAALNPLIV